MEIRLREDGNWDMSTEKISGPGAYRLLRLVTVALRGRVREVTKAALGVGA